MATPTTVTMLPPDTLRLIICQLNPFCDAYTCALTNRALRDAVFAHFPERSGSSSSSSSSSEGSGTTRLRTVDAAAVCSVSRLVWAKGLPLPHRPHWLDTWPSGEVCHRAAKAGSLPVLRWCRLQGCPWLTWQVTSRAAANGHLEVLKWARANGCGRTTANALMCAAAAGGGHVEVLKWLRQIEKVEWGETTTAAAARGGHLDVLQWYEHCNLITAYALDPFGRSSNTVLRCAI